MRTLAQRIYLGLLASTNCPEQEPAYRAARWTHLLWMSVPIIGFMLFIESVDAAHRRNVRIAP